MSVLFGGLRRVEIYHDSMDFDLFDIFQFMALPVLIDAHTVPDLPSGHPSSWRLGPVSTAPFFIKHILAF